MPMLSVLVFDLTDSMGAVVYIIIDSGHSISSFCREHTVSIPIITKGIRTFQKRFLPKIAEEKFSKNAGWIIPTRQ